MKRNFIVATHFVGDGGNFLINALSMSRYVGHNEFPSIEERKRYFFQSTKDNIKKKFYYKDVCLWIKHLNSYGKINAPDCNTLEEYYKNRSVPIPIVDNNSYCICKQHYPLWNLSHPDIDPDKIHDVNIMLESSAKIFKIISTKTNCFNILFVNPSIFTALRHYFIKRNEGYSVTCRYPLNKRGDALSYDVKNADVYEELNSLTIEEYQQLSESKRREIERKYSVSYDEILSLFNKNYNQLDVYYDIFLNKTSFIWDVNWYLSEDDTANNIKRLYDILEFDDYDEDLIRKMYQGWIKSLSLPVSKWRELDADKNVIFDKLAEENKEWERST